MNVNDFDNATNEYVVTVSNVFYADTAKDAVEQMVHWLNESAPVAGYRVVWVEPSCPDKEQTVFIDAEDVWV